MLSLPPTTFGGEGGEDQAWFPWPATSFSLRVAKQVASEGGIAISSVAGGLLAKPGK